MILRCFAVAALSLALAWLGAGPALASGDGCEPGWTLDFAAMPECANIAALVPGNDTRANLLLLLADRHRAAAPTAPAPQPLLKWQEFRRRFSGLKADDAGPYADGEGSRCRSEAEGAKAFAAAVEVASGLSPEERKFLVDARITLKPHCEGDPGAAGSPTAVTAGAGPRAAGVPAGITSGEGRAFWSYLCAADAFYAGRFAEAATSFAALRSDSDPWLSDTAAYMVARTAVNQLQVGAFDQYGTFIGSAAVNQGAAKEAAASLDAYLKDHPSGRYVASARGLQRRVGWLAGWTEDLAARYAALMAQPSGARDLDDATLADEIDSKLLPTLTTAMTQDPILLATLDLKAMRRAPAGTPGERRPDLAEQRAAFDGVSGLYEFLEATMAFYGGNAKAVMKAVPDDTRRRGGDHLWFSRQLLRGLALEAAGDPNARGFWKELLPGAVRPLDAVTSQLALALHDEHRGDLDDVFAVGSPVTDPALRTILLVHDAGPALLRARVDDAAAPEPERQIALFTLLIKELMRGAYGDFLADVARVPASAPTTGSVAVNPLGGEAVPLGLFVRGDTAGDIGCPVLSVTAARLAKDPDGIRDRLCLAEWLRLNGFDPDQDVQIPSKGELGAGPSAFPGPALTRAAIYQTVIAGHTASTDERAFALYRAVKCYEPSGYDGCGGPSVSKAVRRRWYETLKRDHSESRWAKQLPYWW